MRPPWHRSVSHVGHGLERSRPPTWTIDRSWMVVAVVPPSMSTVPLTGAVIWFVTHTVTPPEDRGSGEPKKNVQTLGEHVPDPPQEPPGHSLSVVHAAPLFAPPWHPWQLASVVQVRGAQEAPVPGH